jgi:hypothetical protein
MHSPAKKRMKGMSEISCKIFEVTNGLYEPIEEITNLVNHSKAKNRRLLTPPITLQILEVRGL